MSTIKSSDEHLTLNADGSSKDIKFQANGVEKASISSSGAFTSTTIDATKLTGNLPAISGAALTGVGVSGITSTADSTAITIDSSENVGIGETSPDRTLHIQGTAKIRNASTTYLDMFCSGGGNRDYQIGVNGADFVINDVTSGTSEKLKITSDGRGLSQFTAKAWVKIDGDSNPASIHDSHNVSSVTDNAVAQYTVNFSNNMANANYCAVAHAHAGAGTNDVSLVQMPVGSRAVGSVGCHIMAALNSATTFTNNQDCDTEILIFGD